MAVVELTKKQVIDALKEEKFLTSGHWAWTTLWDKLGKPVPDQQVGAHDKSCFVCAVGAVVRSTLAKSCTAAQLERVASEAGNEIAEFSDLSDVYETASHDDDDPFVDDNEDVEMGRKAAIDFVRTNFPPTVRIDIGDAKPRRGIKVVG